MASMVSLYGLFSWTSALLINSLCALWFHSEWMQYNTIQLIFDIALLPHTCQVQKCTFVHRRHRCNCNAEHCGRGTCSRSLRGGQSRMQTCDPTNPTTEPPHPINKKIVHGVAHGYRSVEFFKLCLVRCCWFHIKLSKDLFRATADSEKCSLGFWLFSWVPCVYFVLSRLLHLAPWKTVYISEAYCCLLMALMLNEDFVS